MDEAVIRLIITDKCPLPGFCILAAERILAKLDADF